MSLFVGNLSRDVKTKDLAELFGKYGKLVGCRIKESFGLQNFGFVSFGDERDAEDALNKCNGKDLLGSRISVDWAKGSRGGPRGRSDRDDR